MENCAKIYVVKERGVLKNPRESAKRWAFSRTTLVEGLAIIKIKSNGMTLLGINEPSATITTSYVKSGMEQVRILLKAIMINKEETDALKNRIKHKCEEMEAELSYFITAIETMGEIIKQGGSKEKIEALNLLIRSLMDKRQFLFQSDETIESFLKTDKKIVLRFFEEEEYLNLLLSYLKRAKALTTNLLYNLEKENLYMDDVWMRHLDDHGNKLVGYGISAMVWSAIVFEKKQGGSDITLVLHPKTAFFLPRYLNTYLADVNPKIIAIENNLYPTTMIQ